MAAIHPLGKAIPTDPSTLSYCFFLPSSPTKRGRFATFSSLLLNPHECHLGPGPSKKKKKKSVEIGRPYHQQTISGIHDERFGKAKVNKAKFDWKKNIRKGVKSRPLWRKVLFASKKMRSVIQLNLVTIVYGMFLFFFFS